MCVNRSYSQCAKWDKVPRSVAAETGILVRGAYQVYQDMSCWDYDVLAKVLDDNVAPADLVGTVIASRPPRYVSS